MVAMFTQRPRTQRRRYPFLGASGTCAYPDSGTYIEIDCMNICNIVDASKGESQSLNMLNLIACDADQGAVKGNVAKSHKRMMVASFLN
jgi:hypothetical protein